MATALVLVCVVGRVGAQPTDNPLGDLLSRERAERAPVRLPTAEESMAAYRAVAGWVEGWAEPESLACPASGVRVGLYLRGRLVGWGACRAEGAGARGALGEAAAGAMASAAAWLVPKADALADEQLRALASDLTISVELAGPLTPLGDAELGNPDASLRPGLDGLAVRVGGEWLVAYPSEIQSRGAAAGVRLPAMAARLLGDPTLGIELPIDLARQHGAAFYRFESVRVAGVGPGGAAAFVHRGGAVVETREVTTASLVAFAAEMREHLDRMMISGEARLGLMGTLDASAGVADPPVASPMQQSLAAVALVRMSETARIPAVERDRARDLARRIMADLAVVEPVEVGIEDDGVAAAVAWVALSHLGSEGDEELGPLFARCEGMLARHAAAERGDGADGGGVGVGVGVSGAVLVWALAERAARTGLDADIAERDLRALYRAAKPGEIVGMMPWLGWAELCLAGEGELPGSAVLRQVREQVWDHQLSELDTGLAERDMAGGVVFTRGFASLPTWATARPVALCATMLGDGRLTGAGEVSGEIVRLIGAFRFLRQLSAREVECAFYARPDLARGGVRAAVWDPRMPPEATAMTLLGIGEMLGSVGALETRSEATETPESR